VYSAGQLLCAVSVLLVAVRYSQATSVQISARVPAVLTGFSGFLRYLQTDAGIIPYLKLGHNHSLTPVLVLHSLLIQSLSAVHVFMSCSRQSLRSSHFKSKGFFSFATCVFYCLVSLILSTCSTHCLLCPNILSIGGTCTVLGATRAEPSRSFSAME